MKFFIKKLITLIITLLVISFLTFTAFSVIPGDAALSRLGKDATEEQLERARDEMGLNDPLLERYGRWVTDAMQGDSGSPTGMREPQSAPFWHSGFRSRCFWQSFPCSSSR
mgnify:CR=1 FL=1